MSLTYEETKSQLLIAIGKSFSLNAFNCELERGFTGPRSDIVDLTDAINL